MAGKNPLLSWLFGSPPEEEPEEDQAPAEPQETAAPPRQEADPFRLDLPPDHAVNRLSRLWRERTGRYSPPSFRLQGAEGQAVIPAAQARQEVARLLGKYIGK